MVGAAVRKRAEEFIRCRHRWDLQALEGSSNSSQITSPFITIFSECSLSFKRAPTGCHCVLEQRRKLDPDASTLDFEQQMTRLPGQDFRDILFKLKSIIPLMHKQGMSLMLRCVQAFSQVRIGAESSSYTCYGKVGMIHRSKTLRSR